MAMNLHSPARGEEELYRDKWKLDILDAFWSEFLQTHTLEQNNRVMDALRHREPTPEPETPSERSAEERSGTDSDASSHSHDTPSTHASKTKPDGVPNPEGQASGATFFVHGANPAPIKAGSDTGGELTSAPLPPEARTPRVDKRAPQTDRRSIA